MLTLIKNASIVNESKIYKSDVLIEGKVTYSDYRISQENQDAENINSGINGFSLNLDFSYFVSKSSDIKYGINVLGYSTFLDFINSAGTYINELDHSTEFVSYIDYNFSKNRLLINPGLRLQNYTSLGETMLEPRISFKYNLTNYLSSFFFQEFSFLFIDLFFFIILWIGPERVFISRFPQISKVIFIYAFYIIFGILICK